MPRRLRRLPPTPMLQAFVCAAQTGNFARAASELNLTASAVSHQISKLEEWWGVRLFERHSRGVDLSKEGQLLLPPIEEFFRNLDTALQAVKASPPSPLQVVCTSSLCAAWLAPRMQNELGVEIDANIVLSSTDIGKSNLSSHPFDLAVVIGDGQYPGHHVEFLMRDMVFPVYSPTLIKEKEKISFNDIQNYPILHRASDHLCPAWEDWYEFYRLSKPLSPAGPRFPDSNMTINLATKGGGIALARTALVYEHLLDGSLVAMTNATMPSPFPYYLICGSSRQDEPPLRQLISWTKAQATAFLAGVAEDFPELAICQRGEQ